MNRVVVAQSAAGLGTFLKAHVPTARQPVVVIGFDARHNSEAFAREAASVLAGLGLRVILLPRPLPTPVLAFAVRKLGTDAGVMVTASHNPAYDNGFKVFLGREDGGSQVASPEDGEIMEHIRSAAANSQADQLPRADTFVVVGDQIVDAYVEQTASIAPAHSDVVDVRWVYSPLHGVGCDTLCRAVEAAGYRAPDLVEEQATPDATFPTVEFPNPEKPEAWDRALEIARARDAELILVNDPDADRLGAAIPDESVASGWRILTGNEIGLLLGWQAARNAKGIPGAALACSLVSTPALEAVAHRHGLAFRATLPGSKWISRTPGLIFGFEESLGYLVHPAAVRDKDGIAAAISMLHLVTTLRTSGRTVKDALDEFDHTFGFFSSGQITIRANDSATVAQYMARLRTMSPDRIGPFVVAEREDLRDEICGGMSCDALRCELEDGARLIIRPSGTEPILKVYLDTRGDSRNQSEERLAALTVGAHQLLEEALHA